MTLTVHGRLEYQACDARTCYPPAEVPLAWEVRVHAPESIQDRPD